MSSNHPIRDRQLLKMLYRVDCPPSVELGEFQLGLFDRANPARRARAVWIGQHVAECPHCTRELTELAAYMTQVATQLPPAEVEASGLAGLTSSVNEAAARIKVLVARLFTPAPGEAAWAVRGDDAAEAPQIFNVGDIQVAIETQADPQQPSQRSVLGLISGADTLGWRAHVWQAGQFVLTVEVDEFGNFTVSPLVPGNYQMILEAPNDDLEVHLSLDV